MYSNQCFCFFSEKYPKVELLDHVIVLCVCVCMCVYLNIYVYICLNKCVLFFWTRSSFRLSLIAASGGHSLVVVCGLLTVVASLVPERGLQGMWASIVVAHGPWNVNSAAASHRLHCPVAFGALSDQGSNQWSLHYKGNHF